MKLLSLISSFTLIFCLQAQSPEHPCATVEANAQFATPAQRRANEAYLENYRKRHPEKKYLPMHYNTLQRRNHQCGVANIIIPVWVHVVHNNGIGNISEAQAEHAIEELNHHFSNADGTNQPAVNTGIQFYLPGFDTTVSSLTSHKRNIETVDLMSQKFKSKDTFVNIWVVKEILDSNGLNNNVLGFSGMPWARFGGKYNGIVVEHPMKEQLKEMCKKELGTMKSSTKRLKKELSDVNKQIEKLEERLAFGQVDDAIFNRVSAKYYEHKRGIEKQLSEQTPITISNLDSLISGVLKKATNLLTIWELGNPIERRKLQEFLFPEGITYDRKKDSYRTMKANPIFEITQLLSKSYTIEKNGKITKKGGFLPRVALLGIEPRSTV